MDDKKYLDILHQEYNLRKKANPRYSLRSFAYFLNINSGTLCNIMQGKRIPSSGQVDDILHYLKFDEEKEGLFRSSWELAKISIKFNGIKKSTTNLNHTQVEITPMGFLKRIPESGEQIEGERDLMLGQSLTIQESKLPEVKKLIQDFAIKMKDYVEDKAGTIPYEFKLQLIRKEADS